ncbi:MAG: HAMP domain-containing protein [Anaerolineae bacterium]|nr:HAMP domain-containing protein [Anaerolineae bacterium]
MNRLWVRLSLAFSLVIICGIMLMGIVGVSIGRDEKLGERLLNLYQLPEGFVNQLTDYFQQHDSWLGVQEILAQQDARLPRAPSGGIALLFANAEGRVLYDAYNGTTGDLLSPEQQKSALEVRLDGHIIGYVRLTRTRDILIPGNIDPFFQQQIVSLILLTASILGVFSIFAGVLVSRILTAPLGQMARIARDFATQGLNIRAEIKGSTEVMDVASAFNEMASALQKAEQHRRNLVADIAHELRTPLTVLKSNLQAIVDGLYDFSPDEAARLLQQTELLNRLVSDLHDLSQAEARQLHLDLDLIDIPTFIQSRAQNFKAIAESHGITLEIAVAPQPAIVEGDVNRFEQVFNNLLNNAITHTPAGGTIRVSTSQDVGLAKVSVQDTGNGILPEYLPNIFERFYRIDPSRSRLTGGAGLGLAIARAIVEMQGGQITVTSDGIPGHGAIFTIIMPLSETALEPVN